MIVTLLYMHLICNVANCCYPGSMRWWLADCSIVLVWELEGWLTSFSSPAKVGKSWPITGSGNWHLADVCITAKLQIITKKDENIFIIWSPSGELGFSEHNRSVASWLIRDANRIFGNSNSSHQCLQQKMGNKKSDIFLLCSHWLKSEKIAFIGKNGLKFCNCYIFCPLRLQAATMAYLLPS